MSCCDGCQSGLSGCESDLPGLYGLYGLNGLNKLMGELLAPGSKIRVGFNYNYNLGYDADETEAMGVRYITDALYSRLREHDIYSAINIVVDPPQYFDLKDGYIRVEVTTKDGQSNPDNIGDSIQYLVSEYLPRIYLTSRDRTEIDYVPPEAQNKPGVAQVTSQQRQPRQQSSSPPPPSGDCVWSQMSFGEYVACQLGIKSPLGGVTAGAAGALVGVGVITLLAVVLLKR